MLPIRAVVESVGYYVDWDKDTQTVLITELAQPQHEEEVVQRVFDDLTTEEVPEASTSINSKNAYENDEIVIYIPRELFFTGGSEEMFLNIFREFGGVIADLADDSATLWRNQHENAETVYISASFSHSDLIDLRIAIDEDLQLIFESIVTSVGLISEFEKETSSVYTRFVFLADVEEFFGDFRAMAIELSDFVFPYIGQLEYLRRIINLYDMGALEEILFYLEDDVTMERFEIYSFLHDVPLSLAIRHVIS